MSGTLGDTSGGKSKISKVGGVGESGCHPLFRDNSRSRKDEKSGSLIAGERYRHTKESVPKPSAPAGVHHGGAKRQSLGFTREHEKLFTNFIAEETARGRRPDGVVGLRSRAPRFVRFMEERGKSVTETTIADVYAFQGALRDTLSRSGTPYESSTILAFVIAAQSLCEYLVRSGRLLENPFKHMRKVRIRKRVLEGVLKESQMAALLTALHDWDLAGNLKDTMRRYLVHVSAELEYASGLRITEVANLTTTDVDIERAIVYVRDGKHGSRRIGYLTDYAAQVLELYIVQIRPHLMHGQRSGDERLFFTEGDRWQHVISDELKRACAEIGVPRITSHGFRHALGYHLLRGGCPLRYIQAILGHKDIKCTEVYTKVDIEDVKSVFDACHPRMHG